MKNEIFRISIIQLARGVGGFLKVKVGTSSMGLALTWFKALQVLKSNLKPKQYYSWIMMSTAHSSKILREKFAWLKVKGSLQERVSKKRSVFKSGHIVLIFFPGSTLKLEDQFLKNLKNMYSAYTIKKKVSYEGKSQKIFLSRRTRNRQNLLKIVIFTVISHFNL